MKTMKVIDFYGKRWIFFAITGVIMLTGIISCFVMGVDLDIQFKGGAILKYDYTGEISADAVQDVVSNVISRPSTVQFTSDIVTGHMRMSITLAGNEGLGVSEQGAMEDALTAAFPDNGINLAETNVVEPYYGQRFLTNGVIALLLSWVLVIIYVWVRFRRIGGLSAGVTSVIALIHDVIIVFFACVIFRIPIGESFVAVAMSIIGFSINDTIVIFDRVRENERTKRMPIESLVNLSLTQSVTRSVNTGLMVAVALFVVYVLAAFNNLDSVKAFALPLAIGTVAGCYSTLCVVLPLWVMWRKKAEASKGPGKGTSSSKKGK